MTNFENFSIYIWPNALCESSGSNDFTQYCVKQLLSKQKKEFDKIVRILIISGIVLIVSGVLIVAFVPDLERGPLVVNGYGAFLVILGIFSFVAISWRNWIKRA